MVEAEDMPQLVLDRSQQIDARVGGAERRRSQPVGGRRGVELEVVDR